MKQINVLNDYSNHQDIKVSVQDMVTYEWLVKNEVYPRENKDDVIKSFKEKFDDSYVCEFIY